MAAPSLRHHAHPFPDGRIPPEAFPLSPAQYGIWLAQQLAPQVPFVIAQYVEFPGPLDLDLLRAVSETAGREFETVFLRLIEIDGRPFQIVDRELDFRTEILDFRDRREPRAAAEEWLRRDVERPVDLLADRMCKIAVLCIDDSDFLVYVKAHHIVLDGYGAMILMNRGAELYAAALEGRAADAGPSTDLRTLYERDRKYRASRRFAADRDYWSQRMLAAPKGTGDTAVPPAVTSLVETAELSPAASDHLQGSAKTMNATPTAVVLAAFACFFSRLSGSGDVLVNIPVSARTTAQLRHSAGMLVNVVPLRIAVHAEDTLGELVGRMQLELLGALRHQGCGIEDIRRSTGNAVSRFSVPLVNVMLFEQELGLGAVPGTVHVLSRGPVGDRMISVCPAGSPAATTIEFRANPNRYREDEIRRQCTQIAELLEEFVAADPGTPLGSIHRTSAREAERRFRDASLVDYWTSTLAGLPTPPELPIGPSPIRHTKDPATVRFPIDDDSCRAVVALAAEQHVDSFVVLHAAVSVLLARLGGVDDVAIGTPVPRTGVSDAEVDGVVGALVLRARAGSAMRFDDLVAQLGRTDREAFEHADVSPRRLAEALGPSQDGTRSPLYRVTLEHHVEAQSSAGEPDTCTATTYDSMCFGTADLQISVTERRNRITTGMSVSMRYATEPIAEGTVCGFANRFTRILTAIAADASVRIGDIDLLGPEERATLVPARGPDGVPVRRLPDILAAAASADPEAVAVSCGTVRISYRTLDEQTNRLARRLIDLGAGPERFVAIGIERSADSVVAVWAVTKAGAAFVPVDPTYPAERIEFMLDDCGAVLGLTTVSQRARMPERVRWVVLDDPRMADPPARRGTAVADTDRVMPLRADHPAYLIYTSGSTGTPKGVVITHRGLANLVAFAAASAEPGARVWHGASPSFDLAVLEMLLAFGVGAQLVVAPSGVYGGTELARLLAAEHVTHWCTTPAVLSTLDPRSLDDLVFVIVGGESCPPGLVERWAPGRRMVNGYGPSEATVQATTDDLLPGDGVGLGNPGPGFEAIVLDARLHPVPVGVVGELYLSGPALARGYHRRSGTTATRFVADPFGAPGRRMYRTGDLMRWSTGTSAPVGGTSLLRLEYVGRADLQVKLRGRRIELGEVEAALLRHDRVGQAVAVLRVDGGIEHLVGYVVPRPGEVVDGAEVQKSVATALPDFLMPAVVVVLAAMPVTANGKIDRNALPVPTFGGSAYRPPRTALERTLVGAFAQVLGVAPDRVGLDDGFFDLGGDSLLATGLVARIRATLRAEVPIRTVFEAPTVAGLVPRLAECGVARPPLVPQRRPKRIPLSYAQSRLWFIHRYEGPSTTYNLPMAARLRGEVDVAAMVAAFTDVVTRHESLRTVFGEEEGIPFQQILPVDEVTLSLPVTTVSGELMADAVGAEVAYRFDLSTEIPIRAALLRQSPDEHVLVLVLHHIAGDGASMVPLVRDVMTAYAARAAGSAPNWDPLPVQYADYALWQREMLGTETDPDSMLYRQFEYWRAELADAPEQLRLPTDRIRPPVQSFEGGTVEFTVDASLREAVDELARSRGATTSMVMQSALAVLLHKLGAGTDILIGGPVAGRTDELLADLVGFFVNSWVLRVDLSGLDDFAAVLDQVRAKALAAYENQDAPFERLVELLNPVRSTAHHALFQVAMALQNNPLPVLDYPGLQVAMEPVTAGVARFDLFFSLSDVPATPHSPGGMRGTIEYASDLFDRSTVQQIAARFVRVLTSMVTCPQRRFVLVDLLEPHERVQVLQEWNGTTVTVPDTTVPMLFARQVSADPDAVALTSGTEQWTYRELAARATRLAHRLIDLGVGPESVVAVALDRSAASIVALLAVSTAGGAYLPIDPGYPGERTRFILEDAAPLLVLSDAVVAGRLRSPACPVLLLDPGGASVGDPTTRVGPVTDSDRRMPLRPEHPAYLIYTSGSTGVPKGVAITHRNLVHLVSHGWPANRPRERMSMTSSPGFDASVYEIWPALLTGAELVLAPPGPADPMDIAQTVLDHGVTAVFVSTPMFHLLADPGIATDGVWDHVDQVVTAGAALFPAAVDRFRAAHPGPLVVNAYGPTETTVCATLYPVPTTHEPGSSSVPIGTPIEGVQVFVLDAGLQPVPVGVPGELYLAGAGVGRGYHGRPAMTAGRFVACPFGAPGQRMYRSGDLVAWRSRERTETGRVRAADLEFVGRVDDQLEIRGFRVEPGEVEAVLTSHPAVAQAAVVPRAVPGDIASTQLVGYVVLDRDLTLRAEAARESEAVERWQALYDDVYSDAAAAVPASPALSLDEDFGGWNASATGRPLPLDEMRQWRDAAVQSIRTLRPHRLLELGAGSGLLLAELAPECGEYWATDFAASAIASLRVKVAGQPWAQRVRLRTQPAHVTDGLPEGHFDTVVLNSVVQYFPDAAYLLEVLGKALRLLTPGGALYLGDVRNLASLPQFAAGVELARAGVTDTASVVRERVRRAMLTERELLLAPEFFTSLPQHLTGITGTETQLGRMHAVNELSCHRYQVILRTGPAPVRSLGDAPRQPWHRWGTMAALCDHLRAHRPDMLRVDGVPHAGLVRAVALADRLDEAPDDVPVQNLLDGAPTQDGWMPHDLDSVGKELGYSVAVTWFPTPGGMDAVFIAGETNDTYPAAVTDVYLPAGPIGPLARYVNDPAASTRIDEIRRFVSERLPDFMVPSALVHMAALPLTAHGKLDHRALPAPEFAIPGADVQAPSTPTEETLAAVFAEVLGLGRVGAHDSFFALGGDSIMSIQLVARAKAAGVLISPRDVFEHKTVSALAAVATSLAQGHEALPELPGGGIGDITPLPIHRWLFERGGGFDRFSQSVLLTLPAEADEANLTAALQAVVDAHDMLRARLHLPSESASGWGLETRPAGTVHADKLFLRIPVDSVTGPDFTSTVGAALDAATGRLDLTSGIVLQAVWFDAGPIGRLLLVAHHLVIDGVSWRILVPDLATAWGRTVAGLEPELEAEHTSMRRWAHGLREESRSENRRAELDLWQDMLSVEEPPLGSRFLDTAKDVGATLDTITVDVPTVTTEILLTALPAAVHGGVNDGLLTALGAAVITWCRARGQDTDRVLVGLEGHGREEQVVPGADLSRTVGWFTTMFPVRLDLSGIDSSEVFATGTGRGIDAVKAVKEQLLAVPDHGIGYGMLRWIDDEYRTTLESRPEPQIAFNYLGRVATTSSGSAREAGWIPIADIDLGPGTDPAQPAAAAVAVNAVVVDTDTGPMLRTSFTFPTGVLATDEVTDLAQRWRQALIALALDTTVPGAGGHTPSDLSLVPLSQRAIDDLEHRCPGLEDVWPLTPLQSGLLFHAIQADSVDAYTVQLTLHLQGRIDPRRLRDAAAAVVVRHPNLRVAFVLDEGNPVQVVQRGIELPLREIDLTAVDVAVRDTELDRILSEDRLARFDTAVAPLLRLTLIRMGPDDFRLLFTNHHLLLDGWSAPLLLKELLVLYAGAGDTSVLPPPHAYRDYLIWLGRQDSDAACSAWSRYLRGVDGPTLVVPGRRGEPVGAVSEETSRTLGEDRTRQLEAFARTHSLTLNTLVQVAWGIVLATLTSLRDVVFGSTVSGRQATVPGIEEMVGLFINTVPVRISVDPNRTLTELLERVRAEQTELLDSHHVGLADIQRAAGPAAVFDTLTVFESYPVDRAALSRATDVAGMRVTHVTARDSGHYPVALIAHTDPLLHLRISYRPDLYDRGSAEQTLRRVVRVLDAVVDEPETTLGRLNLLDEAERRRLAPVGSSPAVPVSEATWTEMLAGQVARHRDAIAVVGNGEQLTYADFGARISRLARWLISRGVRPEAPVIVAMRRSVDQLVATLAILEAGGVYVPIDPDHPAERIAHVLETAQPMCVLASEGIELPGTVPVIRTDALDLSGFPASPVTDTDRLAPVRPDNTAYVIFTSGSTGTPKGVTVTHRGLTTPAQWCAGVADSESRVLHAISPSFDASLLEYLTAVAAGGQLVVAPPTVYGGAEMKALLRTARITHLYITPTVLATIDPSGLDELAFVCVGGETCPPWLVERWATGRRMVNGYGPTETTVMSNVRDPLAADEPITLGVPMPGFAEVVTDRRIQPVPVGVSGELYVAGPGLARGYHRQPGTTATRFVADPFGAPGRRMYRTGDLVRWTDTTGRLEPEYVGRSDFQVKVRGLRIELEEVEAALVRHPAVAQAVAVVRDGGRGEQLVAYIVPAHAPADPAEILRSLAAVLPSYMVPVALTVLPAMPVTPTGKVDRAALPAPEFSRSEYRSPRTDTERIVAEAFASGLDLERVGIDDNFFDLGGNSLSAVRVAAILKSTLSGDVPLPLIFLAPTPAGLAHRLDTRPGGGTPSTIEALEVLIPLRAGGSRTPLFCVHPAIGISWVYAGLLRYLPDRAVYGLQLPLLSGGPAYASHHALAHRYVEELRAVRPHGPYHLLGWSQGGLIAHHMAVQLRSAGEAVDLVMLDYYPIERARKELTLAEVLVSLGIDADSAEPTDISFDTALTQVNRMLGHETGLTPSDLERILGAYAEVHRTGPELGLEVFDGDMLFFAAANSLDDSGETSPGLWRKTVTGSIVEHVVAGDHLHMMNPEATSVIGPILADHLGRIDERHRSPR